MPSTALALAAFALFAPPFAMPVAPPSDPPLADFARTPAPVGNEQRFLDEVAALLPADLATERDAFGSLIVRCGEPGEIGRAHV